METSDSRSVGIGPLLRAARETPVLIGTPQDRHTCAQVGLVRPQLKHSTVSPVIARQPSTGRRRHRPCIDLRRATASSSYREASVGKILIGVIIGVVLVIWLLVSCVSAIF
jgi:hypothetical protein